MRQGELLGLIWDAVDLKERRLAVRVALQRGEPVEPKSEKGRRTIVPPASVAQALDQQRTRQLEERLNAGSAWSNRLGPVFTTTEGHPIDAANLRRSFRRLLKRAGLREVRFHDLRHSCASYLLSQGVPAGAIMELLGHSEIRLTLDTYTHVLPALQEETATVMDAFLQTA